MCLAENQYNFLLAFARSLKIGDSIRFIKKNSDNPVQMSGIVDQEFYGSCLRVRMGEQFFLVILNDLIVDPQPSPPPTSSDANR